MVLCSNVRVVCNFLTNIFIYLQKTCVDTRIWPLCFAIICPKNAILYFGRGGPLGKRGRGSDQKRLRRAGKREKRRRLRRAGWRRKRGKRERRRAGVNRGGAGPTRPSGESRIEVAAILYTELLFCEASQGREACIVSTRKSLWHKHLHQGLAQPVNPSPPLLPCSSSCLPMLSFGCRYVYSHSTLRHIVPCTSHGYHVVFLRNFDRAVYPSRVPEERERDRGNSRERQGVHYG